MTDKQMYIIVPKKYEGGDPSPDEKKVLLETFGIDYDRDTPGWIFDIRPLPKKG